MKSLRARLFLTTVVAVVVSTVLTLGIGVLLARRSIERAIEAGLARQVDALAVREQTSPFTPGELLRIRTELGRLGERVALLPRPIPAALPLPAAERSALDAGGSAQGKTSFLGTDVFFAARAAGDQVLILSRPSHLGAADWRPYVGGFVVAGVVGAAIAGVASFLLARSIARPVQRVAAASRELASGRRPGRVPVEGFDEAVVLAASFNDMAEQLERASEAERRFLLSVSHELKTPLTAVRGYAEGLREGAVEPVEAGRVIAEEAERLERLVQDLLDLARIDQRAFAVRAEPVDLAQVARDAVRRHDPRARSFGVALSADAPGPAPAVADAGRALQVVSNLVENALRCTPAGGSVVVGARPGMVWVGDTGPGLPPEDLPQAFDRFFLYGKYGADRPVGSGLGLAVVKELTQAMGGTVTVESTPGRGSVFAVRLPPGEAEGGR